MFYGCEEGKAEIEERLRLVIFFEIFLSVGQHVEIYLLLFLSLNADQSH